jgi:integrase
MTEAIAVPSPELVPDRPVSLVDDLPPGFRQQVFGPEIPGWDDIAVGRGRNENTSIDLTGLPEGLATEIAWLVNWTVNVGSKVITRRYARIADCLSMAIEAGDEVPTSLVDWSWERWRPFFRKHLSLRGGGDRLVSENTLDQLRPAFQEPWQALRVRLSASPWWTLDAWVPRCDPRIPLRETEPHGLGGIYWDAEPAWLWAAVKWQLSTQLSSGGLAWTTLVRRAEELKVWARWLGTLDPTPDLFGAPPVELRRLAQAYRTWLDNPANRPRAKTARLNQQAKNEYFRAVDRFFSFMLDNQEDAVAVLRDERWSGISEVHCAVWARLQAPYTAPPRVRPDQFIDDTAMSRIFACVPILGATAAETFEVEVDGELREIAGFDDPQMMRMLLLQMYTGRRMSEVLLMPHQPLSSVQGLGSEVPDGRRVARLQYAQTKEEGAPDTILVDDDVINVVEEQLRWLKEAMPDYSGKYLFVQRKGNRQGFRHYSKTVYGRRLRIFADLVGIRDANGALVDFNRTHRFRHTRLTKLAELGKPVHVIQRYAGHRSPTMSMHYVAQREEFEEQSFLATQKFYSDGRSAVFTPELHDGLHLFDRADRFLPAGYCLLPPLQNCDKGNACLTCSEYVTDASHIETLREQLTQTETLIATRKADFLAQRGEEMPEDNVWLRNRLIEAEALRRLITVMSDAAPGDVLRGAGSGARQAVLLSIDTKRYKEKAP